MVPQRMVDRRFIAAAVFQAIPPSPYNGCKFGTYAVLYPFESAVEQSGLGFPDNVYISTAASDLSWMARGLLEVRLIDARPFSGNVSSTDLVSGEELEQFWEEVIYGSGVLPDVMYDVRWDSAYDASGEVATLSFFQVMDVVSRFEGRVFLVSGGGEEAAVVAAPRQAVGVPLRN